MTNTADTTPRRRRRRPETTSSGLVAYLRCSTDEQRQSGLGLRAQEAAIRTHVASNGTELVGVFQDVASGKSTCKRPGLADAIAEIEAGRAGGLVVSRLDRLSRSLLDVARLLEQSRTEGWALIALDVALDTSTPTGRFSANIIASVAELERSLIGERTRLALAEKRKAGVQLGRPRLIGDDVVERVAELRNEGLAFQKIADELNNAGVTTASGRSWRPQSVRSLYESRARAITPA